jgi:parvulin-like peptidyl-prolyl isomerase
MKEILGRTIKPIFNKMGSDLLDNATQDEFSKKNMKKNLWKEEELDFRARIKDEKVIRTGPYTLHCAAMTYQIKQFLG